jgi:glycine/D-amino acid oxidase-like deaminating enzyme
MRTVICGAGAIGVSIAYFLARRGAAVTVIESSGVGNAASGKSGGFLARDWCDGSPLAALARRSFALHAELAETFADQWGYRRVATYGGLAGYPGLRGGGYELGWLSDRVVVGQALGTADDTAQLDPARFTRAMMRAAAALGAELRPGRVTGLLRDGERVAGVVTENGTIEAEAAVIAMGPWSVLAARWLRLPPVFGLKGHSLLFDTGTAVPAEAVFVEYREPTGAVQSPELFPRPDGTTYVCGLSSQEPLPLDPARVAADAGTIARLERICAALSPVLAGAPILARQACYRPVTQDGLPLIGPVRGAPGAYVATGHSVWGMLNAPATGEAMAELILDGAARTVDLAPFDPARLPPLDPARLTGV